MNNVNLILMAGVNLTVNKLTDDECLALFLAFSLSNDWNNINSVVLGYEKLNNLRTENGKMHSETSNYLTLLLEKRISNVKG